MGNIKKIISCLVILLITFSSLSQEVKIKEIDDNTYKIKHSNTIGPTHLDSYRERLMSLFTIENLLFNKNNVVVKFLPNESKEYKEKVLSTYAKSFGYSSIKIKE